VTDTFFDREPPEELHGHERLYGKSGSVGSKTTSGSV
jgi:hypothetical protein